MKLSKYIKEELRLYLKSKMTSQTKVVQIIAPYAFSAEEIAQIKESIPSIAHREIQVVVEPDILAGFMIKDGSTLLDYSLKTKVRSVFTSSNTL